MSESAANTPITTQLTRIYWAIEYMTNLEGQDHTLVIEMSQEMLSDVIDGRGLAPMVEYVKRFCDVLDGPADAERIAAEISPRARLADGAEGK